MQTTTQALEMTALQFQPEKIPELGCGNGGTTMALTAQTGARITGIDMENRALARLRSRAASAGFADRIHARGLDKAHLPVPD